MANLHSQKHSTALFASIIAYDLILVSFAVGRLHIRLKKYVIDMAVNSKKFTPFNSMIVYMCTFASNIIMINIVLSSINSIVCVI